MPAKKSESRPWLVYKEADLEEIARAIQVSLKAVKRHKQRFESAAWWYRIDAAAPRGAAKALPPSVRARKLTSIEKRAKALLKALGVADAADADDGPADLDVLEVLAWIELADKGVAAGEDCVIRDTAAVGRLAQRARLAIAEIDRPLRVDGDETQSFREVISPRGHQGDRAVNDWIREMVKDYKQITGRPAGTSVGAPDRTNERQAGGPLIRFLEAAGRPLGIRFSPDSWRQRVRGVLRA